MKQFLFFIFSVFLISSCIKDDILDDVIPVEVRLMNCVDTIAFDSTYQLEAVYFNNAGLKEPTTFTWISSNPSIISINSNGLAKGVSMGSAEITASANGASVSKTIHVGNMTSQMNTDRSGKVNTTSSYALTGSFDLKSVGSDLSLEFKSDYNATTALPGLYVYLSNNPNSTSGAYEIGRVTVYSGAHTYSIPNKGINDYNYVLYFCKPFNVKVGHGAIN